jgi:hypothetical protein
LLIARATLIRMRSAMAAAGDRLIRRNDGRAADVRTQQDDRREQNVEKLPHAKPDFRKDYTTILSRITVSVNFSLSAGRHRVGGVPHR